MPTEGDLVPSIVDLLEFNAAEVSDSRWEYDLDRLLWAINETVEGTHRPPAPKFAGDWDAEERARRDAEEQARRDAEEEAHRDAEERARRDAEERARRDAEEQARRDAEEQARRDAEELASREAKEQARRDAEEQARREAEEQARREAEELASRDAEELARHEAEEQASRDAEERARRDAEERARRDAQERARRDAEERARRDAEERARRDAEEQARRNKDEAERKAHLRPVGQGPALATESSPLEAAEQTRTRSWRTARNLLRQRVVILATTVGIGAVAVLVIHFFLARPVATIMAHLPNDLRASCTARTDKAADCYLKDDTVVFFRLFDTAAEAKADVVNGHEIAPDSDPCPPSALSVNTPVLCRYAAGPEKGLAMFDFVSKGAEMYYESRWVPDSEPLLRGEMTTKNANPLAWTTLEANWKRLASTR
jgi:hypothetical protein